MPRIPLCPHCMKPIADLGITPSRAKIVQATEEAAKRRQSKIIETEVRHWYKADFQLALELVTRIKLSQAKPAEAISNLLFEAILEVHRAKLSTLEVQVHEEIQQRLNLKK